MEKLFEVCEPAEGMKKLSVLFSQFEDYKKRGKNMFDWLCDQTIEFLKTCEVEDSEKEENSKVGKNHFLVMIAGKSYMMQMEEECFPEEKISDYMNAFCVLAAMSTFKKMGWLEVNCKSKWMHPTENIGFKLTKTGEKMERYRKLRGE